MVGIQGKKFFPDKPSGMVLVPSGSFLMGMSDEDIVYKNILPPLRLLNANEQKDLIDNLNNLDFKLNSKMAA